MSVLTLGTVAFDTIETPFGNSGKVVGGAASYIALAVSHFVKKQHLVSVIGEDFPQEFLAELSGRGACLNGLTRVEGGESFHWAGKYHDDMVGRDTLATDLNVLIGWEPKVCKSGNNADFVMLGNLDPAVQLAVLDQVAAPKLVVLDTMNFWMDVALDNLKKIIGRVDVLTVNDEEARQLTGALLAQGGSRHPRHGTPNRGHQKRRARRVDVPGRRGVFRASLPLGQSGRPHRSGRHVCGWFCRLPRVATSRSRHVDLGGHEASGGGRQRHGQLHVRGVWHFWPGGADQRGHPKALGGLPQADGLRAHSVVNQG